MKLSQCIGSKSCKNNVHKMNLVLRLRYINSRYITWFRRVGSVSYFKIEIGSNKTDVCRSCQMHFHCRWLPWQWEMWKQVRRGGAEPIHQLLRDFISSLNVFGELFQLTVTRIEVEQQCGELDVEMWRQPCRPRHRLLLFFFVVVRDWQSRCTTERFPINID